MYSTLVKSCQLKKNQFFALPGENSAFPLKDSYLVFDSNVTRRSRAHGRYANSDHIKLVGLGSILLFDNHRLTSRSGKKM